MLKIDMLRDKPEDYKKYRETAEQFELNGEFNQDADGVSYEGTLPVTDEFEFIKKGLKNKIKRLFYTTILKAYGRKIKKMFDTKIVGKENLKGIKSAIVTCNHVGKFDSFAVRETVGYYIRFVAADFNNWQGLMGDLARNTGYIPLSNKFSVMKKFNEAMAYYLNKGDKILMYPEQAMWRDYEKPRPLKDGAYHYAVKHNVPIIPLFITFRHSGKFVDGIEDLYYTVHVQKPIYKQDNLSDKENIEYMRKENYRVWKECYEQTYGKKLEYTTIDKSKIKL